MNKEQINIAIEKQKQKDNPRAMITSPFYCLPDYFNDLNAIQSAVDSLFSITRKRFNGELKRVMSTGIRGGVTTAACIHATAAQRAEAYLRTISKWVD